MALLELKGLSKHFGGLAAVDNLELEVNTGEIMGVIGPNGAGKTTVFNVISGVYKPTRGRVIFKGEDITGLEPDVIAAKGLARTWQATSLFMDETVLDNVWIGFHLRAKSGLWAQLFSTRGSRREEREIRQRALEIVEFMGLGPMKNELAKNLPHGHQRALGIAIALAADPDLLLLDEPVTGMNPQETMTMMELISRIRQEHKMTLVLIEHDMRAVMGFSDRIAVLNYGRKIAEGLPQEIKENKEVIEAYLGAEEGS